MSYIEKIISHNILSEYNERTFVRLLSTLEMAKRMIDEKNPGRKLELNIFTKDGLEREILKRSFN